jgi:predicted SnoaL-like aldol condensation-catalyzing enzyme
MSTNVSIRPLPVSNLPAAWVVADIVRLEDGVLAEHWDVIQDEATREQSRSGLPMFGDKFPA